MGQRGFIQVSLTNEQVTYEITCEDGCSYEKDKTGEKSQLTQNTKKVPYGVQYICMLGNLFHR